MEVIIMDIMDIIKEEGPSQIQAERMTGYLTDLIDGARLAPSAANLQPLEYIVVTSRFIGSGL